MTLTLLHFISSHYNEKVRWALDYKGIAHERRALLPGWHVNQARRLSGQTGLPILLKDGKAIHDSTRIIAALEQAYPTPALYPQDPSLRRRALEMEEYFDEEWGPHLRRAFMFLSFPYTDYVASLFDGEAGFFTRLAYRATLTLVKPKLKSKMRLTPENFDISRRKIEDGLQRLEKEIQPSGYLVGDQFSVADLTAAAMLSIMVRPPEFPYPLRKPRPASLQDYRQRFEGRPGWRWTEEMYRRHRGQWVRARGEVAATLGVGYAGSAS